MGFRLALINPNTTAAHTAAMAAAARDVLPAGAQVLELTATRGPAVIEGRADGAIAAAEVVALLHANPGHDAYLVACFADPALPGVRELTRAPVVGIGESALRAASLVSNRFGIVTTLPRSVPEMEDLVASTGLTARCVGVAALGAPGLSDSWTDGAGRDRLTEAAAGLVERAGAEALVLACGAMADVTRALSEQLDVPICDGVAFGALTAHALWRMGVRTSKRGSLAFPEPIAYAGMPALVGAP
ncbi:MAG TPA: aspartate/glutamate racemase family protein [Solirubrobacter sp.]|nr:aspartate/glutamate racemase family protein [Solirubrobacter sp.]